MDYLSFSWLNIILDVATVRPYIPKIVDCFDGISEAERERIQNSALYHQWIQMKHQTSWSFNRLFIGVR